MDAQAAIAEELESQKDGQTLAAPLVAYNPFGTNSQALYVYFTTDEAATVSYTVSVSDEEVATIEDESLTSTSIADFTREVDDGESATEFEFLVMGLIPNVENTVSITATYEDGSTETTTFACEMCDVLGSEELQLSITEGESDAELEDGLYAVLSNSSAEVNFVYLYDNDGILRGEIPSINGRSYRLVFEQVGDFTVHGGQHGVTYGGTDGLEDGQSYVYLFDNNIGTSSTSDFDYASIGLTNTGATSDDYSSYYYKYLVNENEGTFELVDSIETPYSGFVSSVQEIGSNVVIDSGNASIFGEYDEDGTLIRSFEMDFDSLVYRVFKYDL